MLRELYKPFLRTEKPFLVMSPESAEMTKYVANALLSTKISFINEMANLCERMGADINDVRRGIGHDSRIGFAFLFPGVGYGGSCFPKDVRALVTMAEDHGVEPQMMRAVDAVNEASKASHDREDRARTSAASCRAKRSPSGAWRSSRGPTTSARRRRWCSSIGCSRKGRPCRVHDPEAMENVRPTYGDKLTYCPNADAERSKAPTPWRS